MKKNLNIEIKISRFQSQNIIVTSSDFSNDEIPGEIMETQVRLENPAPNTFRR